MRLLLDTHVLFWWLIEEERLSDAARAAIAAPDAQAYVSVATAWEIAIKVGKGKWPEAKELLATFEQQLDIEGFGLQPVTVQHVRVAGLMPSNHKDPFDRLLLAQAQIEVFVLVTSDIPLRNMGVATIW